MNFVRYKFRRKSCVDHFHVVLFVLNLFFFFLLNDKLDGRVVWSKLHFTFWTILPLNEDLQIERY